MTTEPTKVTRGTTVEWSRDDLSDYPASSWTLTYQLRGPKGAITITAAAAGDGFAVSEDAATTAAWIPGVYAWAAFVDDGGGVRHKVDEGSLEVEEDLALAPPGFDSRSYAAQMLERIEAVLERRATKDQMNYSFEGRSLGRTPIADLLKFRDTFRAEVANERKAERIAKGLGSGRTIGVRFGNG